MSVYMILFFLAVCFFTANLPWFSDRLFGLVSLHAGKLLRHRLLEWLLLYFLTGLLAVGLERHFTGERYSQGWEFYTVTFCLFVVFAIPGYVFRYDLKKTSTQ